MRCCMRAPGQERGFLAESRGRQRAQRREVVDDPDAAAVRREHEVVIARLDRDVAHRDRREVAALELRPSSRRRRCEIHSPNSVPR